MHLSSEHRAEIVVDFARRHGGTFDPAVFLKEVQKEGPKHEAYSWFQWEDDGAAHQWRLEQARRFVRGLTVKVEIKTIEHGALKIVAEEMPLAIAPLDDRAFGGGYRIAGPKNSGHLDELARQAATRLRSFVERYSAALVYAGVKPATLEKLANQIARKLEEEDEAA